ncbi:MAG: elongation factor G [Acidobacteriota bacterium]|nr:elongation factor G [Acidobacteriota bacterium]
MKCYAGSELRNVALVGHAHSGKTTLVAAMLQAAHMTLVQGRVEDGSAVTAYDEEDVARHTTMANAVAFAEWSGVKVNLVDTPGFHMFVHEARAALLPVEAAVVVVNAAAGVESVTERVWRYAGEMDMPRMLVLNQMDHAKVVAAGREGWERVLESMRVRWGRQVVPVQWPIFDAAGFRGVVDLVTMEAFVYRPDSDGVGSIAAIPADLRAEVQAAHEALVELVAEGKDELMEEFFAESTIPEQHLISALHEAIREDRIFPVLFVSGLRNIGTDHLLDFVKVYAPCPVERQPIAVRAVQPARANGSAEAEDQVEMVMRRMEDGEPLALYVYKTMVDPFAGRISFFKVVSGSLKNDATVQSFSRGELERMAHLSIMQGRKPVEVTELHAGDLGVVAKLRVTLTGDTLGARGHEIFLEPMSVPEPAMTYAIEPRTRNDEDKLAPALHKLMEEDPMVRFYRDAQTNEFLVAGAGQPHIESLVSRLKRRYHAEVTLKAPKVPYRETIRGRVEAQGRHKKQTGGHGQFGDCTLRLEPLVRGSGIEFVNQIFGGAIPRQYIPAVERGVQESAMRGYLAGYPVTDFRVTLLDGSFHDVDSSEMAFKMAGRLAFRKCMESAKPALLEPVMRVEIETPDEFAGAVMSDLNGRRGRVQGMERMDGGGTLVRAEVPLAEMLSYGTTLTSITQGRGSHRMEMDHYDLVPQALAEKIIASARRPLEEYDA